MTAERRPCAPPRHLLLLALAATSLHAAEPPPAWAYPVNPPDFRPRVDDGVPRHVPGSAVRYSVTQLRDRFLAPVWHPAEHPALPPVVAGGRKPEVYACGFCHRADGPGAPENADIAGLPAAYIVRQLNDFRNGLRSSAVPSRAPISLKLAMARHLTDDEMRTAAAYFASLPHRRQVEVIETAEVPKTRVAGWTLVAEGTADREPIGRRIVEVPQDVEQFENRDSRARFTAYVPPGAIAAGERLVRTGGDARTLPCTLCHGADLKGVGEVPRLAGRSPSYLVRQLYDIQSGARRGDAAAAMKPVVEKLTIDEMLSIAAYLAAAD